MEVGEILFKKGLLDQRQLDESRRAQSDGARLDEVAVRLGFVTEEAALQAFDDLKELCERVVVSTDQGSDE